MTVSNAPWLSLFMIPLLVDLKLISASRVRCDRQFPCSNCSSRGQDSSCAYPSSREPPSGRPHGSGGTHVQDRINRLENLVLDLMQQQHQPSSSSHGSPPNFPPVIQDESPSRETPTPSASDIERPLAAREETQLEVPASPSDYGTIRVQESGSSYVSSAHWVAVLDSIAQLRDHFVHEDQMNAHVSDPGQLQQANPALLRPQLLYGCSVHVTLGSILQAIPPRSVVDRMVFRYFNDLDMATGKVTKYTDVPKLPGIFLVADRVTRSRAQRQVPSRGTYHQTIFVLPC